MIVFLVVVPPKEKQHDDLPPDYVVVNENSHQLPLGVLNFGTVDSDAMARANGMRTRLKQLNKEISQRQAEAADAQMKAYIIQLLIQEKTDLAANKYEKHYKTMKKESLMEISMYVYQKFDADLVPCLFPELPKPYKADEFQRRATTTVETHQKGVFDAKSKLREARENASRNSKFFQTSS